jgi:aspartyl-tRNA(Asn)/glutamyl-tRNA(Gln) amidotransferase subunit C
MAITRDDVLHVAALAQLELSEDEIARLTEQLGDILEAVSRVSELDLSDVPPTSHPLSVVNVLRPDEPQPSLPLEDVFANAPERDGDHFRVPPTGVAEESSA